jgi:acetyl-CoA carboxylase biotin carboxyl carrier protein
MELTPADLARIVEAFETSGWEHLRVSLGESLLELSKSGPVDGAANAPVTAQPEPVAAQPEPVAVQPVAARRPPEHDDAGLHEIVSPSVGVFWRAPSPASAPFVSEGDPVADGDTVCIVEVMKLMNHVPAGVSGTVRRVLAGNGQMVERGQPLLLVEVVP